nr:hypothetical protein CFP56_63142 [Quercus suber]
MRGRSWDSSAASMSSMSVVLRLMQELRSKEAKKAEAGPAATNGGRRFATSSPRARSWLGDRRNCVPRRRRRQRRAQRRQTEGGGSQPQVLELAVGLEIEGMDDGGGGGDGVLQEENGRA